MPVARPVQRQTMPQPQTAATPRLQQSQMQPAAAPRQAAPRPKGNRALWVALQFIIGLLVIAGVAAAIVMLYVRYYQ